MNPSRLFIDRQDAGHKLAEALRDYADRSNVVVLGLPRGGVPVAYEVAVGLGVPLDVCTVRKLGAPRREEMAIGAIAGEGVRVLNADLVDMLHVAPHEIDAIEAAERRELRYRETLYRDDTPPIDLTGKIVILVDDGLATGATMRAAVRAVSQQDPARVIVAVPTASRQARDDLRAMAEVDEIVCLMTPLDFRAVGLWYRDFRQVSHDEVRDLLHRSRSRS